MDRGRYDAGEAAVISQVLLTPANYRNANYRKCLTGRELRGPIIVSADSHPAVILGHWDIRV